MTARMYENPEELLDWTDDPENKNAQIKYVRNKLGQWQLKRRKWAPCPNCGRMMWISQSNNKPTCNACKSTIKSGRHHSGYKGTKDIPYSYYGQLKRGSAKPRGLEFSITIEDLQELFDAQQGRCAISGVRIFIYPEASRKRTASIDRIDSDIGYVKGNVQWVHKKLNQMKWDMKEDEFFELCRLIALAHPSENTSVDDYFVFDVMSKARSKKIKCDRIYNKNYNTRIGGASVLVLDQEFPKEFHPSGAYDVTIIEEESSGKKYAVMKFEDFMEQLQDHGW